MQLISAVANIKAMTLLRRVRALPFVGDVMVRRGQEITPVQVVARGTERGGYHVLRASEALGVPAALLAGYLLVKEGATVQQGTPLMRKPRRFGRAQTYASPYGGTVYDIRAGCIILKEDREPVEVRAMMAGRVVGIAPRHGATIQATGAHIEGIWDSGKDGFGRVRVVSRGADETLDLRLAAAELRGSVLVCGRLARTDSLRQLDDHGVRGIVAGSMPSELAEVAAKLSMPVLLTDGFGEIPMSAPVFRLLQDLEGREASLFARTPPPRPQPPAIMVPMPVETAGEIAAPAWEPLEVGAEVRLLRAGEWRQHGKVIRIHLTPRKTELGFWMPGADVQLADGRELFVPYTNLERLI
jgi:hypothetical protein